MAAHDKYPVLNRDNLTILIQMLLSNKRETFSEFFTAFLKSTLNFESFVKKMTLRAFVFPKLLLDKCLECPVSDNHSTSNMVNVPKHCSNLHDSSFIMFIDHCQFNWVGKSFSFSHAEPWDCSLTHCLLMRSILFLIETI